MSCHHRCIKKVAVVPISTLIKRSFHIWIYFLQFCVDCDQVEQVDRSSLMIKFILCRPVMYYYLVLDALGEIHIVSFV